MLLSLIIPVYKVEEYIEECIESVCSQLREGIEVIMINDGTPDQSMIMAKSYINKNYKSLIDQFVFIDQKNKGQSVARNNALEIAKGEYIAFLDSDDRLNDNFFDEIIDKIILHRPDVINLNAKAFGDENKTIKFVSDFYIGLFTEEIKKNIFEKNMWMPWLHIFRKKIMADFKFPLVYAYEDMISIPFLYFNVSKIVRLEDELILYRVRDSSLSNNIKDENINSLDYAINLFEVTKDSSLDILLNHCYKMKFKFLCRKKGVFYAFHWIRSIKTKRLGDFFSNFPIFYALIYSIYYCLKRG